ncbi:MAG: hypothetical protein OXQ29_04930 [Rhodospirillaceae bacterium]|nr:hypothetical protein [Rhodospirillaceae bacterium]
MGPTLMAACMALGLFLTAFGFFREDWPHVWTVLNASPSSAYLYALAGGTAVIAILASKTRLGHVATTALLGVAISLVAGGFWPLLAVAIFFGAAWSLGDVVLRFFGRPDSSAGTVERILLGTGLFGTLVGAMVHIPINRPWVYWVMLAVPVAITGRRLWKTAPWDFLKSGWSALVGIFTPKDHPGRLVRPLLGSLVLLYLAMAFLPELAHDALAMHLFVPAQVAANQSWDFDPARYVWTYMPMLANWTYTIGWMLAGETAVRLMNLGFLLIAVQLVRDFVIVLGGCRRGADWSQAITLSTPLTFLVGTSAFVDAFWSAYLLAGLLLIVRWLWNPEEHPNGLVRCGALLGFAAASKAIALPYLPLMAVPALARPSIFRSKTFWRSLAAGAALFLLLGTWPYVLAWVETGNPVFPFYNSLFRSEFFPAKDFEHERFSAALTWDLAYQLTFSASRFIEGQLGAAGFQWVTLTAPVIAAIAMYRARRAAALLAFAALALLTVFSFQPYLRYVYPVFLILAVLIGFAFSLIDRGQSGLSTAMTLLVGVTLVLNLVFLGSASSPYRDVPVLDQFRDRGVDDLVVERAPVRRAVELVNLVNTHRFPVAFFAAPLAADLKSSALFWNWYNLAFVGELRDASDSAALAQVLRGNRARYLIVDRFYQDRMGRIGEQAQAIGELLGRFGPIAVYRLKDDWFYREELIRSPDRFDAPDWQHRQPVQLKQSGTVVASERGSIVQSVPVVAGEFYRSSVLARCADRAGFGRVQVNWLHRDHVVTSSIKVFPCRTAWSEEIQELVAPAGAVRASVYGTSHDGTPVEIGKVSLRVAAHQIHSK